MADYYNEYREVEARDKQAQAAKDSATAYRERTVYAGKTAHADRLARARTDGLRLSVDLLAGQPGNHSVDEAIDLAERFARYIIFGKQADSSA